MRVVVVLLSVLGGMSALGAAPQPQKERPRLLQWRVPGAAESLEATAWVRLQVTSKLGPTEASAELGLVQTVAYLFSNSTETAHPLLGVADRDGLPVSALDADLVAGGDTPGPLTVSLEPLIDVAHYQAGAVLGRAVRVVATAEMEALATAGGRLPAATLRVDRADLEDRRRWAADTLVLSGQTRMLWEGPVHLTVDQLYADYLYVRAPGVDITQHQPHTFVRDDIRGPEGGILDLPPRASPLGAPRAVTHGPALVRASGRRLFPVSLQQGVLNIIDLRAVTDAVGSHGLTVAVTTVPLDQMRDFPGRAGSVLPTAPRPRR